MANRIKTTIAELWTRAKIPVVVDKHLELKLAHIRLPQYELQIGLQEDLPTRYRAYSTTLQPPAVRLLLHFL